MCSGASSPRKWSGCSTNMKLEAGRWEGGPGQTQVGAISLRDVWVSLKRVVSLYLHLFMCCTCAHSALPYLAVKAGVRTIKLLAWLVLSVER